MRSRCSNCFYLELFHGIKHKSKLKHDLKAYFLIFSLSLSLSPEQRSQGWSFLPCSGCWAADKTRLFIGSCSELPQPGPWRSDCLHKDKGRKKKTNPNFENSGLFTRNLKWREKDGVLVWFFSKFIFKLQVVLKWTLYTFYTDCTIHIWHYESSFICNVPVV